MFGTEWVWPILAIIGLIVVLTAFELLSILIADRWDADETRDRRVEPKRAA
jgi:hypothetical protein